MDKTIKILALALFLISFGFPSFGKFQEAEKAFSMPASSPLYPSPPIQYRDNRILTIIFKTTPEILQKIVPKPLVPNPFNLMFIYVSKLNIEISETEKYPYLEAGFIELADISSGHLGPVKALLTGKIKAKGNFIKLLEMSQVLISRH